MPSSCIDVVHLVEREENDERDEIKNLFHVD